MFSESNWPKNFYLCSNEIRWTIKHFNIGSKVLGGKEIKWSFYFSSNMFTSNQCFSRGCSTVSASPQSRRHELTIKMQMPQSHFIPTDWKSWTQFWGLHFFQGSYIWSNLKPTDPELQIQTPQWSLYIFHHKVQCENIRCYLVVALLFFVICVLGLRPQDGVTHC